MLLLLIKFSGILAILSAWGLVVYPAIHFGIKAGKDTISLATLENEMVGKIIGLGLIIGTIFQVIFLFYIVQKFSLHYSNFGCLLYLTANIATMLVSIFTFKKHPVIHKFFVRYYFVIMPISLALITYPLKNSSIHVLFTFSLLILFLYLVGQFLLFVRHREGNGLMEAWAFVLLSIWTIVMTFA